MDDKKPAVVPLDQPTVPDALADIPGGEEGLLPKQALTSDLKVTFPPWTGSDPTPGKEERVELMWGGRKVAEKWFSTPITDPTTLFATIPMSELHEGQHALTYKVILATGNDNESDPPVIVTIDKTSPVLAGTREPLSFQPDLIGNKVTALYLDQHGNKLPATVPLYDAPKPGDRINFYWEKSPDGLLLAGYKELTQADMSLQIEFDGDMIITSGDGQRYATYEVQDRAGNLSALSRSVVLTVDAQPVPLNQPSVEKSVPSGSGAGTLDPSLVTGGVVVVVPAEIDPQPGDTITVYWAGVVPGASHETSTPIIPDGLRFAIPASKVPGNIGKDNVVEVYYSVTWQGGKVEESDKYPLTILPIAENKFPKPQCVQAAGSPATLRLSSVPNGANFTINPWVFIAVGQKMHMWIEGVNKTDGTDLYLDIFTDRQVIEAETTTRVEVLLPRSFLEQLRVNSVFWADIEVSFNDGASFLGFPRQDLTLVD